MGAAGPYWVTAHPVSWLPYEWPVGDDRQISSKDQRSVKLRVRPSLTGTHRCHSSTPTGRRIMLTVKLAFVERAGTRDRDLSSSQAAIVTASQMRKERPRSSR